MKYAIILPDGAADEPVDRLDGRTPLEAARTPHTDRVAREGRVGTVVTVPEGFLPGSDVATLSLLGYDPKVFYTGRAPLEAAAREITTTADQLIFRCNFVTILAGKMIDFTAGHISQDEADRLIADLNEHLGADRFVFHCGVSYRNLMVAANAAGTRLTTTPPHDIPGRPVRKFLASGCGAKRVRTLMDDARALLAGHPVNIARNERGENPATDIWLWGQGRARPLALFSERFGITVATIAAVDLVRGIARSAGMELIDVSGATGYLDTDYRSKGRAAVGALEDFDAVVVHIEAPDEAGHLGDAAAKVRAIEMVDEHVVGPIRQGLAAFERSRILIAPDHPTPVGKRVHTGDPPPFCMAGAGIEPDGASAFTETAAVQTGFRVDPGHTLMDLMLRP